MKRNTVFYLLLLFWIAFTSCKPNEETPYILFKNTAEDIILSDTWNVPLNTTELLYIECGFVEKGHILYERQVDDEPERHDLIFEKSEDIKILSKKRRNNLRIETAVISTTFDNTLMSQGSEVKITVRDRSEMGRTFTYVVR